MARHNSENFNVREFIRQHLFRGPVEWDYDHTTVFKVLNMAERSLRRQPMLLEINSPINICGDLHGQYADLLKIFQNCGYPFDSRYLFLGDYVDRGRNSLETIMLLLACKIEYPDSVYLIRGNHEIPSVNKSYGFRTELRIRYYKANRWDTLYRKFSDVFAVMPIAATVNKKILCMHGGLSPNLNSLEDIKNIERPCIEPMGLTEDILWSDPSEDQEKYAKNDDRGCSYIFGHEAIHEMCKKLGVNMIVRAHQLVDHGYEFFADRKLVTLFSAPGYNDVYENLGAVMQIARDGSYSFYQFDSANEIPKHKSRIRNVLATE